MLLLSLAQAGGPAVSVQAGPWVDSPSPRAVQAIEAAQPALLACYAAERDHDDSLEGLFSARVRSDEQGTVAVDRAFGAPKLGEDVPRCVLDALRDVDLGADQELSLIHI